MLAEVADDELGRVGIGGLDLPCRPAPLVWPVRAPVVAPVHNMYMHAVISHADAERTGLRLFIHSIMVERFFSFLFSF